MNLFLIDISCLLILYLCANISMIIAKQNIVQSSTTSTVQALLQFQYAGESKEEVNPYRHDKIAIKHMLPAIVKTLYLRLVQLMKINMQSRYKISITSMRMRNIVGLGNPKTNENIRIVEIVIYIVILFLTQGLVLISSSVTTQQLGSSSLQFLKLQMQKVNPQITAMVPMDNIVTNNSNISVFETLDMVDREAKELKSCMLQINEVILKGNITRFLRMRMAVELWGIFYTEITKHKKTMRINKDNINCTPQVLLKLLLYQRAKLVPCNATTPLSPI